MRAHHTGPVAELVDAVGLKPTDFFGHLGSIRQGYRQGTALLARFVPFGSTRERPLISRTNDPAKPSAARSRAAMPIFFAGCSSNACGIRSSEGRH